MGQLVGWFEGRVYGVEINYSYRFHFYRLCKVSQLLLQFYGT